MPGVFWEIEVDDAENKPPLDEVYFTSNLISDIKEKLRPIGFYKPQHST